MKMFTLVSIIAASAIVSAQTPTTAPAMNKAPNAVANKNVKNKKAKKMKTTQVSALTPAPAAQTMPISMTTPVAAPTAGTSTTTPMASAPQKKLGGYVISDTTADQSNAHGTEAIQSVTTVGGSYQITESTKAGIGQAFESASNGAYGHRLNSELDKNNFRAMYVEPFMNTTYLNFLGTDRTKLDVRARLNNYNALWNKFGGAKDIDRHYQLSSTSVKALTPQFALTMYNEARVYQYTDSSPVGTRISLLPGAGFAMNDSLSFYQIAGYIINTKDGESLTNKRERFYLETGLNYAPAAISGLNINLLAFQDKMMSSQVNGEKVSSFSLYSANNNNDGTSSNDSVVYEAIINYNF